MGVCFCSFLYVHSIPYKHLPPASQIERIERGRGQPPRRTQEVIRVGSRSITPHSTEYSCIRSMNKHALVGSRRTEFATPHLGARLDMYAQSTNSHIIRYQYPYKLSIHRPLISRIAHSPIPFSASYGPSHSLL